MNTDLDVAKASALPGTIESVTSRDNCWINMSMFDNGWTVEVSGYLNGTNFSYRRVANSVEEATDFIKQAVPTQALFEQHDYGVVPF